ncbi:MAG: hypothetical protein H6817_11820, partial [Phycisphaerales bacterium]|nr:hypothetical protein [Phycisphaerales bacterium]
MSDGLKKTIMGVVAVGLGILAIYSISGFFGEDEAIKTANTRTLMDINTGDLFDFEVSPDWGPYPHKNPKTGTETLYPIEWCYNRECGSKGGTAVILNGWLGKKEPTYCPVCGSLV